VRRWVNRIREGDLGAMREDERYGRSRTLNAKDRRNVQSDLRKTPRAFDLAATLWDGPILSAHLRRPNRVDLGVRQCQRRHREQDFRLLIEGCINPRHVRTAIQPGARTP